MEDKIISELVNTKLWKLQQQRDGEISNLFHVYSNMWGYSNGRYRLEITKLKRKREGSIYKISIFWTPYNPDNLVFKGRFNFFDELKDILNTVNKDLLDVGRVFP